MGGSLTKNQRQMLAFLKWRYVDKNNTNYQLLMESKKRPHLRKRWGFIESEKEIPNYMSGLVLYSPLRRNLKEWNSLIALEEKGYIIGFYKTKRGSLSTLNRGKSETHTARNYREDDIEGVIFVFFTPKALRAKTDKLNQWANLGSGRESLKSAWSWTSGGPTGIINHTTLFQGKKISDDERVKSILTASEMTLYPKFDVEGKVTNREELSENLLNMGAG